jgi:hypothetical protein
VAERILLKRILKKYDVKTPEERDHLGDLGVAERIILKRISKKYDVRVWNGLKWLRITSQEKLCFV